MLDGGQFGKHLETPEIRRLKCTMIYLLLFLMRLWFICFNCS